MLSINGLKQTWRSSHLNVQAIWLHLEDVSTLETIRESNSLKKLNCWIGVEEKVDEIFNWKSKFSLIDAFIKNSKTTKNCRYGNKNLWGKASDSHLLSTHKENFLSENFVQTF